MADYTLDLLIDQLRYQVVTPRVTTMGPCSTEGCAGSSRGSRECPACLIKRIYTVAGEDNCTVPRMYNALVDYRNAWWASEEAIETLLENNRD